MSFLRNGIATAVVCVGVWAPVSHGDTLYVDDAVERVLSHSPRVRAYRNRIKSAEASSAQAGALPNPELEVGAENLGTAEFEVGMAQKLELGGKRSARLAVAKTEVGAERLEYEFLIMELRAETYRRYLPLAALNRKQMVLDSLARIADQSLQTIKERYRAGAAMEVDTIRAHIALKELTAESTMLQTEMRTQRRALTALWGEKESSEFEVSDELFTGGGTESEEYYLDQVSSHPQLRIARKDIERIRSNIGLLRAETVPDITVSAGYIRNNERGENASKLGVSSEIPLFNRNRKAIRGEEYLASAREQEMENELIERKTRIRNLLDQLENKDRIYEIEKGIVEESQIAYEMMLKYYERGAVDFLSVSEALTDLLEHKNEMVNLRLERELLRVELCLVSNACFK